MRPTRRFAGIAATAEGGNLNGELGLVIAPNGHILTVNRGDGKIVETTPGGPVGHRANRASPVGHRASTGRRALPDTTAR